MELNDLVFDTNQLHHHYIGHLDSIGQGYSFHIGTALVFQKVKWNSVASQAEQPLIQASRFMRYKSVSYPHLGSAVCTLKILTFEILIFILN